MHVIRRCNGITNRVTTDKRTGRMCGGELTADLFAVSKGSVGGKKSDQDEDYYSAAANCSRIE